MATVLLPLFLLASGPLGAQASLLDQGEQLFLEDRLEEALPVLEKAVLQNPGNERVYLYLGTIYEQLGQFGRAVTILQKGTLVADDYLDLIYFNIGNNLIKQDKLVLADEMYTRAAAANPRLPAVYLNRANNRVQLEEYASAVDDYSLYLTLQPATDQRENIEKIIALLSAGIETERVRIREDEARRAAEEARQKALLSNVLNSLQNAADGTKNISVETEGIEEVQEESDIVD